MICKLDSTLVYQIDYLPDSDSIVLISTNTDSCAELLELAEQTHELGLSPILVPTTRMIRLLELTNGYVVRSLEIRHRSESVYWQPSENLPDTLRSMIGDIAIDYVSLESPKGYLNVSSNGVLYVTDKEALSLLQKALENPPV